MLIINLIIAILILTILAILTLTRPRAGILMAIIYLAFLGDFRRIIADLFGQSEFDPLLLVTPILIFILILLPIEKYKVSKTNLSTLVVAMVTIMIIQIFNPIQGNIKVGLAGTLFSLVPICWYFIGNKFGDQKMLDVLLYKVMIPLGILASLVGLYQTFYGFLPFQQSWIENSGISSLYVWGNLRPFGFFVSAQEYITFLMICLIGSLLSLKKNYVYFGLTSLVLLIAIFLASSRGAIVLLVLSLSIAVAIQRAKNFGFFIPKLVIVLLVVFSLSQPILRTLNSLKPPPIIAGLYNHQISGLIAPLDEDSSTIPAHFRIMVDGIKLAFKNILGMGLGQTGNTGKFGGGATNTENDLNLFISTGVGGGMLYLIITFLALKNSLEYWYKTKKSTIFIYTIILLATLLGWCGGLYSISAIIWLAIGIIDNEKNKTDENSNINALGDTERRSRKVSCQSAYPQ